MSILTAKPESVYGIQWMGTQIFTILDRENQITVRHGDWIRESLSTEIYRAVHCEAGEIKELFTVAPDQQTEAVTPVAKAEPVEVAEVESAKYWAVMKSGKIVNYDGRPLVYESKELAYSLVKERLSSSPVGDQYTVAPLFFSPVAKPEPVETTESAEYWAVVQVGNTANDFQGIPALFFDRNAAECWISKHKISRSAGQHFTIISILLPVTTKPKPKPNIKGEVWVLVNKETREVGNCTYVSRDEAESSNWWLVNPEVVQLV